MNSSLNSKRCDPVVLSFTSFMHPCYLSHNPSVTRDHAVAIGVVKVSSPSVKLRKGTQLQWHFLKHRAEFMPLELNLLLNCQSPTVL